MQEQIEEMEMQIGKIESEKNIKTTTDIALLRMRVEALEDRVKELESRFFKHVHFSGYFSGGPE